MGINERISELIVLLQLNPNAFADRIGVKSPVVYNIIKGRRSKPSYELLQKILATFNTINANWLLMGEGDMWWDRKEEYALGQEYSTIETRIGELVDDLRHELGEHASVEELSELTKTLLAENVNQKYKITALYVKQEQILEVIKNKLGLDF